MHDNQVRYLMAMAIFRKMKKDGLITAKEYADLDTMMLQRYGLSSRSLLSDKRLIIPRTRGNMRHCKEVA